MSTQRQGSETSSQDVLEQLTRYMDSDWCNSRKGLRERVQSRQWWTVVAANNAGYRAISSIRSACGDGLFLSFAPVVYRHGPVIACAAMKTSLSETRLQSILRSCDERLLQDWTGQDLVIVGLADDAQMLHQSVVQAVLAEPRGRCLICHVDMYDDDDCHYCQHDLLEVFPEVGSQVVRCYREAVSHGFEHPVILLLNVLSGVGRQLCEELRGPRETDSALRRANETQLAAAFVPHAVSFEQLKPILGEDFDENEVKTLTKKPVPGTHALACLISDAGPILLKVPLQRRPL